VITTNSAEMNGQPDEAGGSSVGLKVDETRAISQGQDFKHSAIETVLKHPSIESLLNYSSNRAGVLRHPFMETVLRDSSD